MPSCLWISKCQAHDRKLAHSAFLVITECIRTQNQMCSIWIFEPIIYSMDTSQKQTSKSYWQLCQCFWQSFHWNFSIYVLSCILKARTVSVKYSMKYLDSKFDLDINIFESFLFFVTFILYKYYYYTKFLYSYTFIFQTGASNMPGKDSTMYSPR